MRRTRPSPRSRKPSGRDARPAFTSSSTDGPKPRRPRRGGRGPRAVRHGHPGAVHGRHLAASRPDGRPRPEAAPAPGPLPRRPAGQHPRDTGGPDDRRRRRQLAHRPDGQRELTRRRTHHGPRGISHDIPGARLGGVPSNAAVAPAVTQSPAAVPPALPRPCAPALQRAAAGNCPARRRPRTAERATRGARRGRLGRNLPTCCRRAAAHRACGRRRRRWLLGAGALQALGDLVGELDHQPLAGDGPLTRRRTARRAS
ncbi:hypothetical protein SAMN05442782_1481 [Streptomyces sp. OK228]|nr:hypothetical protein SAMN05442782_1481 [Streptomyces sp. OK228]